MSGHKYPDILGYSWAQFLAFLRASGKVAEELNKESFSLTLIATRGEDKSVKRVLEGSRK